MALKLLDNVFHPDVLSCLADLSNDEVFTPPKVAKEMLDMLPQELFRNPNTKFLDPACKSGIFLREITERLNEGLKDIIPDPQKRIDHILHNQVYGIAITQITALLSRRSVYCSKDASGKYSLSHFDTSDGNIRFKETKHYWENGSCKYCGASKAVQDREEGKETHAYEFIHKSVRELANMKFDVIISNPPYQLADGSGGSTDAAMPIYNKFIQQSKKLQSKYLVMIVPSKWMVGGRGLDKFREEMISDTSIRKIFDFEDSKKCFSGVHLDGGVCYFLRDRDYSGKVDYVYTDNKGVVVQSNRYLSNEYFKYVIRDNRIMSILEKTGQGKSFSEIVSSTKPYGIRKDLFNSPERYPNAKLSDKKYNGSYHIYGVKGLKGGARRVDAYINSKIVDFNSDIEKYKLFFTTSYSTNAVIPPQAIFGKPGEICTETFLSIGPFKTEREMINCNDYIQTNFFRALLYFGKGSMQVTKSVFSLVPLQDFSKSWTDMALYKKYKLTQNEIDFIESLFAHIE